MVHLQGILDYISDALLMNIRTGGPKTCVAFLTLQKCITISEKHQVVYYVNLFSYLSYRMY